MSQIILGNQKLKFIKGMFYAAPSPPPPPPEYFAIEALEDLEVWAPDTCEYSSDGINWDAISATPPYINAGEKLYFKGDLASLPDPILRYFYITQKCNVSGNIMSLIYGDDFKGQTDLTGNDYIFSHIFEYNPIVDASRLILPATTLSQECYEGMFDNCDLLTSAPELPAIDLSYGCYWGMFRNCTSLVSAPELPATTTAKYCYCGMFEGCTSLTQAPDLPATKLVDLCYSHMFTDCTSLVNAPALPSTSVRHGCYRGMFEGCTSLTTAPELPATILLNYCYAEMFKNCTSLTTAPELPAPRLNSYCYDQMFEGCTKLNYIKALFTNTPSTSYTANWVKGVSSSGTFVKNANATWDVTGDNGVPAGWTVQTA